MGHNFARNNVKRRESRRRKNNRKILENYTERLYREHAGDMPREVYKVLCQKKFLQMIMSGISEEIVYVPRKLRKVLDE